MIKNPKLIQEHLGNIKCFPILKGRNEKPVFKLDLQGNVIKKYDSIKIASADTGISSQEISQSCKNKNKITREYKWRYV